MRNYLLDKLDAAVHLRRDVTKVISFSANFR